MTKRIGGNRKTRGKFKRPAQKKGKLSLRDYLANYERGDNVLLKIDSISMEGRFHPRFMGKRGIVTAKRGTCYEVMILDGKKDKMLIVHPVHMRKC
jgi:large subunit ribosomal protein L21e